MKNAHAYLTIILAGLTAVFLTVAPLHAEGKSPSKTASSPAEKNLKSGKHIKMQWKKAPVKKRTGPVASPGSDVESLADRFPGAKAPAWKKVDRKKTERK